MKERIAEIDAAIHRYMDALVPIPSEWLVERAELKILLGDD